MVLERKTVSFFLSLSNVLMPLPSRFFSHARSPRTVLRRHRYGTRRTLGLNATSNSIAIVLWRRFLSRSASSQRVACIHGIWHVVCCMLHLAYCSVVDCTLDGVYCMGMLHQLSLCVAGCMLCGCALYGLSCAVALRHLACA